MIKNNLLKVVIIITTLMSACVTKKVNLDNMSMNQETVESKMDVEYYPARGSEKDVAIIFLGGSEGGMPDYEYEMFSDKGYASLALAYLYTKNSFDDINMIPMEYFKQIIEWYKNKPEIQGKKIVLLGSSKGAEISLMLGATYPEISGVICEAPSSVIFQGSTGAPTAGLSLKGESLNYVPFVEYDYSTIVNYEYADMFRQCLLQEEEVVNASIPVEKINGPILLLSGEIDTVWPAPEMGAAIIERLKSNDFQHSYKHIIYKDAGHDLTEYNIMGGTVEGNKFSRIDSDKQILDFLGKL